MRPLPFRGSPSLKTRWLMPFWLAMALGILGGLIALPGILWLYGWWWAWWLRAPLLPRL